MPAIMTINSWLVFVGTLALLFLTPGPAVLLVAGEALAKGAGRSMWSIAGILAANIVGLGLSFLGVAALLSASPLLFTLLKWAGVGYLAYLGVAQWRRAGQDADFEAADIRVDRLRMFLRAFTLTALNPKIVVFYAAFLPQFLSGSGNMVADIVILSGTFLFCSLLSCLVYAGAAARARSVLYSTRNRRLVDRVSASALVGAAIMTIAVV